MPLLPLHPARRAGLRLAVALVLALMVCGRRGAAEAQTFGQGGLAELELVLAVDISASVDAEEYRLQMDGIAGAFRDEAVVDAIIALGGRGIAVTLMQWSAGEQQAQSVFWTLVADRAGADRFARLVHATPRAFRGKTTAIGSALRLSAKLFAVNPFPGRRRSIDVSGDGPNNAGHPIWVEKTAAVASGITINGLAIIDEAFPLKTYYEDHVVGGPGAFVVTANGFDDFARAMRVKLLREISPLVAWHGPGPAGLVHQARAVSGLSVFKTHSP